MGSLGQWFKSLFGGKPKKKSMPRVDLGKRFELMGRLGQGSMSKVWRARDQTLGRTICLNIPDKEKTQKFQARFLGLHQPTQRVISVGLRANTTQPTSH